MATSNLSITDVAPSQNSKATTQNTAHDELDKAIANRLSKAVTDGADTVLTTGEGLEALGNMWYELTGALTADRNVIVPTNNKLYMVRNDTTGTVGGALTQVTFKTSAGAGPALRQGEKAILYCDGTDVKVITRSLLTFNGTIGTTFVVGRYTLDQSASFPYKIISITHELRAGTDFTFDLEINTTDVTGIAAQVVTTTEATDQATAANDVVVGDQVSLNITAVTASPQDLGYTMEIVRTD